MARIARKRKRRGGATKCVTELVCHVVCGVGLAEATWLGGGLGACVPPALSCPTLLSRMNDGVCCHGCGPPCRNTKKRGSGGGVVAPPKWASRVSRRVGTDSFYEAATVNGFTIRVGDSVALAAPSSYPTPVRGSCALWKAQQLD